MSKWVIFLISVKRMSLFVFVKTYRLTLYHYKFCFIELLSFSISYNKQTSKTKILGLWIYGLTTKFFKPTIWVGIFVQLSAYIMVQFLDKLSNNSPSLNERLVVRRRSQFLVEIIHCLNLILRHGAIRLTMMWTCKDISPLSPVWNWWKYDTGSGFCKLVFNSFHVYFDDCGAWFASIAGSRAARIPAKPQTVNAPG